MPRAATAILAIACSATYLSGDAGSVPDALRCVPKGKRGRALSKGSALKQHFTSRYEATDEEDDDEQDELILARLASDHLGQDSWSTTKANIEAIGEVGIDSKALSEMDGIAAAKMALAALALTAKQGINSQSFVDTLPSTSFRPKGRQAGAVPALSALPEELLIRTLAYVGTSGRAACRAGHRSYDSSVKGCASVPTFPVLVCVKQHCYFGPQPVTTTWQFDVAAPSTPAVLQFGIDSPGSYEEGSRMTHQSEQSGGQVLRLCRELRELQTTHGVHYKEDGRMQVEVAAKDAAGRTLLDHTYEHRIFCSKADDLLELLTESESPLRKVSGHGSGNDAPRTSSNLGLQGCGRACARGRRARSGSRAREGSRL